jgi:hypothetical protein
VNYTDFDPAYNFDGPSTWPFLLTNEQIAEELRKIGYTVEAPKPKRWPFDLTMHELFHQDLVWVSGNGDAHQIADMTLEYIANVIKWVVDHENFVRKGVDDSEWYSDVLSLPVLSAMRSKLYAAAHGELERPAVSTELPPTYSSMA